MEPPSGPPWTAGQVAQQLEISESTLRTWHRRYGLDPHDAEPGHYRRYREEDVTRLRRMLELVKGGMLASEAARAVQHGESASVSPARDTDDLVAAAGALDTERCGFLLDSLFTRRGVVAAWELVCCPALVAVDGGHGGDPALVAVEHALSWALLGALHRLPRPPAAPAAAPVLLACTEDEQHTLPLAALSAALAEYRVPSRMLGAATPLRSLERAVLETQPDTVVLWAHREETASPGALRALRRYPVRRIAAGPGWGARLAAGSERVTTLRGALTALAGGDAGDPGSPSGSDQAQ
ncbi:MAG TPA: MerR family transcriptional regulator [Trebonia sp.]|nr:MerR family transcriptional regulator [Trebonia sp.]